VIIVTSMTRDFVPSSWGWYAPTWVDLLMFAGSFGLFMTHFLLFLRYIPMIAIAEVKVTMPKPKQDWIIGPDGGKEAAHGH
jgi:molybdopterin-containing oxidoreductase family membrane subunit